MFIINKLNKKYMKNVILPLLIIFSLSFTSALTSGESTILLGAMNSMAVLVIFFLVCSVILQGPMKVFFLSLSFLSILASVGMGVSIIQEFFSEYTKLVDLYGGFYYLMLVLTAVGLFALIIWLVIVVFKQLNSYQGIVGEDDD